MFGLYFFKKSDIRSRLKRILLWQGQKDISAAELDKLVELFTRS